MDNDSEYKIENGNMPYIPPDLYFDINKEIELDQEGNVKHIKNLLLGEHGKPDYTWLKRLLAVMAAVCVLFEGVRLTLAFTPNKWKYEFWRPIIVRNVLSKSQMNLSDKNVLKEYLAEYDDGEKTAELRERFDTFKQIKSKSCLLYKSQSEIREMLGEPNEHGYTEPDLSYLIPDPDIGSSLTYGSTETSPTYVTEAYFVSGDENGSTWLAVVYMDDYVISVAKVTK